MNIRLDIAIKDITGKTGRMIIEARLDGERVPAKLAELADIRVKKSKIEIASSLEGEWKDDLLFVLEEYYSIYSSYREKIKKVEIMIESLLNQVSEHDKNINPLPKLNKRKKAQKNDPTFNVRPIAWKLLGVDLYQIEGISHGTVLWILSKLGDGIHKFPSAKHFVSGRHAVGSDFHRTIRSVGGRLISSRTPKGKNQLSQILRQAANSIGNTKKHPLKDFFNRIAFRKGRGAAITATARKLATIIYHMLTKKEAFSPHYHDQAEFQRRKKIFLIGKQLTKLKLSKEEKSFILG